MGGQFNQFQWGSTEWNAGTSSGTQTVTNSNWAPWNLCQLNTYARIELADPSAKWWTDTEINQYINDWQDLLNHQFEFVWSTATILNSSSSLELAAVAPDMQRLDAIYYTPGTYTTPGGTATYTDTATRRLSPRTPIDLDIIQQDWRAVSTSTGYHPEVSYQYDAYSVNFWPPPAQTGTYIFEYPQLTTLGSCSATMVIPPWTRYSAINYTCYRAYARAGPNQNTVKAMRYKKQFSLDMKRHRKTFDAFFPQKAEMLRPGRKFNIDIISPRRNNF